MCVGEESNATEGLWLKLVMGILAGNRHILVDLHGPLYYNGCTVTTKGLALNRGNSARHTSDIPQLLKYIL